MMHCPVGTYRNYAYGSVEEYVPCPPGRFRENIKGRKLESCIKCPAGTYTSHFGSQNKIKLSCASSYADNRSWVVPRATDNTQNIFHLHIQNCASVNIRLSQLQAFASKHFSPIWLENFVKYLHRNLRRLPLVSIINPFVYGRTCRYFE